MTYRGSGSRFLKRFRFRRFRCGRGTSPACTPLSIRPIFQAASPAVLNNHIPERALYHRGRSPLWPNPLPNLPGLPQISSSNWEPAHQRDHTAPASTTVSQINIRAFLRASLFDPGSRSFRPPSSSRRVCLRMCFLGPAIEHTCHQRSGDLDPCVHREMC